MSLKCNCRAFRVVASRLD